MINFKNLKIDLISYYFKNTFNIFAKIIYLSRNRQNSLDLLLLDFLFFILMITNAKSGKKQLFLIFLEKEIIFTIILGHVRSGRLNPLQTEGLASPVVEFPTKPYPISSLFLSVPRSESHVAVYFSSF